MIPKFKAAMFDMDGTLLHTMRYWRLTAVEMLLGRNIIPSPEEMARVFTVSSRALSREVLDAHGVEISDEQIIREMEHYMLPHYQKDATMKPRVDEYLQKLHEAGVPMCIATQAPREFARTALERLGIAKYFAFITDCYEQGMRKSDPQFFHRMAGKLGVRADEMCVFEDALYAIRGAKEAGCPVIAIRDEIQKNDWAQIQAAADIFVSGYGDLL